MLKYYAALWAAACPVEHITIFGFLTPSVLYFNYLYASIAIKIDSVPPLFSVPTACPFLSVKFTILEHI